MADSEQVLRALLGEADTVAALEAIYERQVQRILLELSQGITRPGADRAVELLVRLRTLIADLDPSRESAVRSWIERNIPSAFVLGDDQATEEVRAELAQASAEDRAAFGHLVTGFTAVSDQQMRAIAALMEETLGSAAEQIRRTVGIAVQRTQLALPTDAAVREASIGAIVRGASGRQLSDDIAGIILEGKAGPDALARLQKLGFRPDLVELYQRLSKGQFININGRNYDVRKYANLVGRTMMREAITKGAILRLQANGVDHIRISLHDQQEADVCTIYAGRIYYIGQGEDPVGFPAYTSIPSIPLHPHCTHGVEAYPMQFKSPTQVQADLADAALLPDDWYGQGAGAITKKVHELTYSGLVAIAPRGAAHVPADSLKGEGPSRKRAA